MKKASGLLMAALLVVMSLFVGMAVSADGLECPICDVDLSGYTGELNEDEIEGLLLALNDEYHAWAVYDQVLADFGDVRPFSSILQSEATHIEALAELFEAYDVAVPKNAWVGTVPSFDSVEAAAAVGVQAEIDNAALYEAINSSTERDDILEVYASLQRASEENHLPAFQRVVDRGTGEGTGYRDSNGRGRRGGNGATQGNGTQGEGYGVGDRGQAASGLSAQGNGTQGQGYGVEDRGQANGSATNGDCDETGSGFQGNQGSDTQGQGYGTQGQGNGTQGQGYGLDERGQANGSATQGNGTQGQVNGTGTGSHGEDAPALGQRQGLWDRLRGWLGRFGQE